VVLGLATAGLVAAPASAQGPLRVVSDRTVRGFIHIESVAYDPREKVLYASEFGTHKLDPTLKDGNGRIVKLGLDGKVLEAKFLPDAGGSPLHKPKGIWIKGSRLWVTDIDSVWVFDLKSRKGQRVSLPGARFANDTAVLGNALYVSDNAADRLFRVEPADFLNVKAEPRVTVVLADEKVHPNGLYPAGGAALLVAGFTPNKANPLYTFSRGRVSALTDPLGRVDGLYRLADGSVLGTDWSSGSLFQWTKRGGMQKLASGFKGPADFCIIPGKAGYTAVVPDLVQGTLRLVELAR
jgi:hypothetical protein